MANPRREAKRERSQQAKLARQKKAARRRTMKFFVVIAVVALIAGGAAAVSSLGGSDSDDTASSAINCPAADGTSARNVQFTTPPSGCIDPAKKYTATFDTTEGTVVVDLDTTNTPKTVDNFVSLARYHYYDNTNIFRTDTSIDIIQGGSPHTQDNADAGPGYNIADEGSGYTYTAGDLVMARTGAVNSGGGQYFFGTGPNVSNLDGQGTYVKFGKTTQGLDVLQKILALHSGAEPSGPPSKTVTVNTVKISEA